MQQEYDIGFIGLAVMGQNLVLNLADHGFSVALYNRTSSVTQAFAADHWQQPLQAAETLAELVQYLARPRKVFIMVQAGAAVDAVLDGLIPLLQPGDIIVDAGNSHYTDTEQRELRCQAAGLRFVGAGVSGGEEGARTGPSIMPGGSAEAWEQLRGILSPIAAQVNGQPCVAYMGPGGAGHYVKMVHNGIEYSDMQLIGEAYHVLQAAGFTPAQLSQVFFEWNQGPLQSYLIEITGHIFAQYDSRSGAALIDSILDSAEQKGTGRWTVRSAVDNGVAVGSINAALEARLISSLKQQRVQASKLLQGPTGKLQIDPAVLLAQVEDALLAAKIVSYAQGFDLLGRMSTSQQWQLPLAKIAAIWRGGCIIRARFLEDISAAYEPAAGLQNLMLAPHFAAQLNRLQASWRALVAGAVSQGIPVPAFSAGLAYYDSYRCARLPANLLQAQRDFFGAHGYQRLDSPADQWFHSDWPAVVAIGPG